MLAPVRSHHVKSMAHQNAMQTKPMNNDTRLADSVFI